MIYGIWVFRYKNARTGKDECGTVIRRAVEGIIKQEIHEIIIYSTRTPVSRQNITDLPYAYITSPFRNSLPSRAEYQ